MAVLDIITYGHPTLREEAKPYEKGEVDEQFIKDMLETMYKKDGVGLAANQVNVAKRLIVVNDMENEYVLINPKIIATSEKKSQAKEGCLSIPEFQASVERSNIVVVQAENPQGEQIEIKAKDLLARILQHEIDHLDGVLYIDRSEQDSLVKLEENGYSTEERPSDMVQLKQYFKEKYHPERTKLVFEKSEAIDV